LLSTIPAAVYGYASTAALCLLSGVALAEPGYLGAGFTIKPIFKDHIGSLKAIDPSMGAVKWNLKNGAPLWGGEVAERVKFLNSGRQRLGIQAGQLSLNVARSKGRAYMRPTCIFQRCPMPAPAFLIVDDHPLFLEALQTALYASYPGAAVEVAGTINGAKDKLAAQTFDLVLLDLKMPDSGGLEGLKTIRSKCPKTPLAVISAMAGYEVVQQTRSCGADGFIFKSQQRSAIMLNVDRLLRGEPQFPAANAADVASSRSPGDDLIDRLRQLTPQQLKVLTRVCEAKLNKQIAFELGVTETTVKAHITLIFKKLGVHSRTQAVLQLQRIRNELEDTEFSVLLSAQA
jgi:DNA-binding NarL/FixJ family response regulator